MMLCMSCILPLCLYLFFYVFLLSVLTDAAEDNGITPCSIYDENPNSDGEIPMVSPPKEVVGMWNGTNCGLNDPSPTSADLSMYPNGTNIWYFNNIPQTGDGVEVVIGWNCLGLAGTGYWWGQTADAAKFWCNLFQVEYDETSRQATYINYAVGGEGQFAQASSEGCPTSLVDLPIDTLQATFQRTIGENETFVFTCRGNIEGTTNTTSDDDDHPTSCNSQFQNNDDNGQKVVIPDPFSDGKSSLPIINATSCQAIDSSDDSPSSGGSAVSSVWRYYLVVLLGAAVGLST